MQSEKIAWNKKSIFHVAKLTVTVGLVVEFWIEVLLWASVSQAKKKVLLFLGLVQVNAIFSKGNFIFV